MAKAAMKALAKAPPKTDADVSAVGLDIEEWPLSRFKADPRNARTHPKEQIAQLRASIRKFGFVTTVCAKEDGTIIAGHGRIEAARKEKIKKVRTFVARDWTEAQCLEYALGDNRIPQNAGWDEERLRQQMFEAIKLGVDLAESGFSAEEYAEILQRPMSTAKEGLTDPDEVPEPPAVPVSQQGDLWILGAHRLICGDSTNAEIITRLLAGAKPHLMVTDPPYGVEYDPNWRNEAPRTSEGMGNGALGAGAVGKVLNDDKADWTETWKLFPGDVAYVWHGALHAPVVAESLAGVGLLIRSQVIWDKTRLVIGRGDYHWQHEPCWYVVRKGKTGHWNGDRKQTTVWAIQHQKSETGHGTQKPVECMKRPIENNSVRGDKIFEPFSGSGTTLIAAEMTERVCYACELNPLYIDVAVKRWQEFTGEKARHEDGRAFEDVAAERLPKAA